MIAWCGLFGLSGCSTAPPAEDGAASYATMSGVSAPEQAVGFVVFWVNRWEERDRGVVFHYSPPLDSEPTVGIAVYPTPDNASDTHLRDRLDAELEGWARPRPVGEPPQIDRVEPVSIRASDGVSYEGWRSTVRVPGTRMLTHLFVFEKQAHVVQYAFRDDGLDPVLAEGAPAAFITETLGGLHFRRVPDDPPSASRRASAEPRPEPAWIGPDSLLSEDELERVYDIREAALRWAFDNNGSDLDPPAFHCIAQGREADPSEPFLGRFADSEVPVRPRSACDVIGPEAGRSTHRNSVVDPRTGAFGLYFRLGRLAWTGGSTAQIGVIYMQGGAWGTGWLCAAASGPAGRWEITSCQVTVDM